MNLDRGWEVNMSQRRFAIVLCAVVLVFAAGISACCVTQEIGNPQTLEGVVQPSTLNTLGQHEDFRVVLEQANGQLVVLRNTSNWLLGKYSATEMQQQLQPGRSVRVETRGYRVQGLAAFPNIVAVEPVTR